MSIDKTWINNSNKFSDEYVAGAFAFVERAQQFVDTRGLVKCPCNKCLNIELQTIGVLESHLFENGFLRSYTNWYWHGEEEIIPTNRVVHQCHEDEMMDVLNDIAQPNNCEDDENEVDDEIPPASECRGTSQYYNDLFAEMESPLFPGCDKYTSLNFVAKLMHFKVLGKIPNKIFDGILELLEDAFPSPNKIPKSHYAAKRLMRKLGLGYESIHVCKNDCALFWKENAGKHTCPICGEDRWVDKNTKGKKVAQKVMRYFPLTPRLMRKYASRHISQHMRWHHEGRVKEDGIMRHPADGKAWKDFDRSNPTFAMEPRNVRLGLAADGFNPFGNMSLSYSMWPVVLTTYNLPPWLCMKETNFMLTLLIHGPHSLGKDFDVFLRPLVDELKELWVNGVQTRDVVDGSFFKLRAALLWTINDFPARSSLSGWSGQGYTACPTCNVSTPSVRLQNKVAFYGHRHFLPMGHQIRKKKKLYGSVEKRPPPEEFSTEAIFTQMNFMPESLPGKHVSYGEQKRKRTKEQVGWRKKNIFFELPYWANMKLRHNLDVMHVEKNVCDSLVGTIVGLENKTKDTISARVDLEKMKIRPELHLRMVNGRMEKPAAKYTFIPENRHKFCRFLKSVKFPDGFASNLRKNVIENDTKITGLKSHDCHVILQRLLPIGVHSFLEKPIAKTIIDLCTFFKIICARTLVVSDLEKVKTSIVEILCGLEIIFPPAFFDVMVHLMIHLPQEAIDGARPEGSIAEGYVVDEALTFCSMYFKGVETRFNRPDRNVDAIPSPKKFSVFQSQGRPIGKKTLTTLDDELKKTAEWYILNNCVEILPYIQEHKQILLSSGAENLDQLQKKEFPMWFYNKLYNLRQAGSAEASEELFSLASGSSNLVSSYTGCIVNGVRFLCYDRDKNLKTQNSGILVPGVDNKSFYGQLEEVIVMSYLAGCSVVLFKCKWFDTDPTKSRMKNENNITRIFTKFEWYKDDKFILATQAKQIFYLDDLKNDRDWKIVEEVHHRNVWDTPAADEQLDPIEIDVMHDTISSDFQLFVDLGPLPEINFCRRDQPPSIVNVDTPIE
ncbi:uncharacterized protein LOC133791534 [Humulus lupulus]|uniref:uncharacterized protein LOC133791534 n=1 Tax=Humulus lupulus TaxID=3486 RepID=UPI002B4039C0|nr:uncharacterized protein LOC133791534 [Humulus lupulus]